MSVLSEIVSLERPEELGVAADYVQDHPETLGEFQACVRWELWRACLEQLNRVGRWRDYDACRYNQRIIVMGLDTLGKWLQEMEMAHIDLILQIAGLIYDAGRQMKSAVGIMVFVEKLMFFLLAYRRLCSVLDKPSDG